ncbi:HAD hydrolase-like protein [Plantactinospora sp. CA-294935]|uniref:HAD hydrolase-like protein n=1 Tax=Plantactinospora sp. CA-294935 TaxID=3240012 RepID=UPI003D8DC7A5
MAKPEPEIFRRPAARPGVPVEDCVVVGDAPYFDARIGRAAAGQAAGAVLVDRPRSFDASPARIFAAPPRARLAHPRGRTSPAS